MGKDFLGSLWFLLFTDRWFSLLNPDSASGGFMSEVRNRTGAIEQVHILLLQFAI
jgi:hypothetical protein